MAGEATLSTHSRHRIHRGESGVHVKAVQYRAIGVSKSLTNERTHPYLVEIPVAAAGLDVLLNRQIMKFHESRQLQLRHGRMILRGGENYYRWCFPDLMTALAPLSNSLVERSIILSKLLKRDEARRIAANIVTCSLSRVGATGQSIHAPKRKYPACVAL